MIRVIFYFIAIIALPISANAQVEAPEAITVESSTPRIVDEQMSYELALSWFNNMPEKEREGILLRIKPLTENMVRLHRLTEKFSAEEHSILSSYENDRPLENDLSGDLREAVLLMRSIREQRAQLVDREDFLMHGMFLEEIR